MGDTQSLRSFEAAVLLLMQDVPPYEPYFSAPYFWLNFRVNTLCRAGKASPLTRIFTGHPARGQLLGYAGGWKRDGIASNAPSETGWEREIHP